MAEILRFFVQYEAVLYFVLGLGGIIYLYRFWNYWQEVRLAVYGLEREASRARLNQSAVVLFVLLLLAVVVFIMVTFVATTLPAQSLLATPTLDLVAAQPEGTQALTSEPTILTATPLPTVNVDSSACQPNRVAITAPNQGETISGAVEVRGTVDIPNFGFYKFEVAQANEELWLTIQAGRNVVRDGILVENWDTSRLPPGPYVLQLVVTDNAGEELPPCRIPVSIGVAQDE
jgi:hypothetical protein